MKPDDRDGSIPVSDEQEAPSRSAVRAAQAILGYITIKNDINLSKHPAVRRIAKTIAKEIRAASRRRLKFYACTCPDTGRVFICEPGVNNNLCEVFARNDNEKVESNAEFIVRALNRE